MVVFIALNIADLILTITGLKLGLTEGNFIYSYLFSTNLGLGIAIKLLLTFIIAFLVKPNLFKILNIVFACIVIWNAVGIVLSII